MEAGLHFEVISDVFRMWVVRRWRREASGVGDVGGMVALREQVWHSKPPYGECEGSGPSDEACAICRSPVFNSRSIASILATAGARNESRADGSIWLGWTSFAVARSACSRILGASESPS